ncbi:cis-3-hydroxy-L-proline dehydratase [Aureimonas frigidaquae]|uniref:cis-3-hydroxy-L-proline dehydratase n=1 Tax=Aureimonas frigidaquae TaxID=424757 RepID=UPI000780F1DD|nr:aconitase family protein [Aureimonas frigidaquae]
MTVALSALPVISGSAQGPVLALAEPISFWGGIDPRSGRIIDVHHPQHGASVAGKVLMMRTSRGSCSGSGVLVELALAGHAPAALLILEPEDVATLGALVAARMFGRTIPVLRLSPAAYHSLSRAGTVRIDDGVVQGGGLAIAVAEASQTVVELSPTDERMLAGEMGDGAALAMRILVEMARQQGAARLTDVSRAHIDGCIYAGPANLLFAETMEGMGARTRVPTTMNAISVDRVNWERQGVPATFGDPASRLADAYVRMGCAPTFTCAPYHLDNAPSEGEAIGWSESNAVIFANSVLGARTAKHADFLDLCIAVTGRAPLCGPFLDCGRRASLVVDVELADQAGAAVWPLLGHLAGTIAGDRIPLLRGLAKARPTRDDLKAMCAAFGTTSSAPMLHVEGITPEAAGCALPDAPVSTVTRADLARAWKELNDGPSAVELVAVGSPHASLDECRALAEAMAGRSRLAHMAAIVTAGRHVAAAAAADGTRARLAAAGIDLITDLCWCSITRPVFPVGAKTVLTTSGKYAHYGPGLSGCTVRLGTLDDCVEALTTGHAPPRLPPWLKPIGDGNA